LKSRAAAEARHSRAKVLRIALFVVRVPDLTDAENEPSEPTCVTLAVDAESVTEDREDERTTVTKREETTDDGGAARLVDASAIVADGDVCTFTIVFCAALCAFRGEATIETGILTFACFVQLTSLQQCPRLVRCTRSQQRSQDQRSCQS
jgi:hypothetical protein